MNHKRKLTTYLVTNEVPGNVPNQATELVPLDLNLNATLLILGRNNLRTKQQQFYLLHNLLVTHGCSVGNGGLLIMFVVFGGAIRV